MSAGPLAESGNQAGARCVLWHAPGSKPPAELLGALAKRGFVVRAVHSAYAAMAELCVLERLVRSTPSRHYVLLLVEPSTLGDRRPLLEAARRYAPGAVTWVYEAGANQPLREHVEEVGPGPAPAPASERAPRASAHALRLAGEGPSRGVDAGEDPADKGEREGGDGLGHLLSDEELAMLLDEPEPRAGGGSADGD